MSKKSKIILLIGGLIVVIVVIFALLKVVLPDESISLFGNRKDNTVEIEKKKLTEANDLIKKSDFITSSNVYVGGVLIVNVIIDVKKDTKLLKIEQMLDKVLELFSENEKKDYDFQVFVTCKEDTSEGSAYPIIGYKHKTSVAFKWTNNS